MPVVGSAAATTRSRPSGTRASAASSDTATYSASVPASTNGAAHSWPNTWSPGENRVSPAPIVSTVPAPSAPSTIGKVAASEGWAPLASQPSMEFTPAARTLMRTWRGPVAAWEPRRRLGSHRIH